VLHIRVLTEIFLTAITFRIDRVLSGPKAQEERYLVKVVVYPLNLFVRIRLWPVLLWLKAV